jgi:iron-sulfur cluster assembly accessory protein
MLKISPLAVERLKEAVLEGGNGGSSLRVVAIPAEAGGLQYMLTMEKESQPEDTVLKIGELNFLMDSDSAPFLDEATIDYVEQLGGRVGFVIKNPMFSSGGGCGSGGGGCGCGGGGGGGGCGDSSVGESGGGCGCGDSSAGESGGGCGCGASGGGCGGH